MRRILESRGSGLCTCSSLEAELLALRSGREDCGSSCPVSNMGHSSCWCGAMASKRTLNARNLETLGAAEGAEAAAQEVRKRLTAIARATTDVDSRRRKAPVADLEAQHQAITGAIAAADPIQALQLLVRFLELAELIGANGYGQFDELIPSVAPALGEAELAALQIAEARGDVDAYMAQFDARQLSRPALAVLDGAAANLTEWRAHTRVERCAHRRARGPGAARRGPAAALGQLLPLPVGIPPARLPAAAR